MKLFKTLAIVITPLAALGACGGGDTSNRLDLADPVVRFVHASPQAPNLTLSRGTIVQAGMADKAYKSMSEYFNVDIGNQTWSVKAATGGSNLGTADIDAARGNNYTLVALPGSTVQNSLYVIKDPYNKPLTSDSARLRIMNASFNASNIDLYMTLTTDIASVATLPKIAATAYMTAGPASGNDSVDIPGGTYKLTITTAGTKTILFSGTLTFANNADILLLTLPSSVTPGGISVTYKLQGSAAALEVPTP
jgi:hypothetical protein